MQVENNLEKNVYIHESLCCTPETAKLGIVHQLYFNLKNQEEGNRMGLGSLVVFPFGRLHKTQRSWTMVKSTSTADCHGLWLREEKSGRRSPVKISIKPTSCTLGGKVSLPLCALAPAAKVCPPWRLNRSVPPLPYTPPPPVGPRRVEQQGSIRAWHRRSDTLSECPPGNVWTQSVASQ